MVTKSRCHVVGYNLLESGMIIRISTLWAARFSGIENA